TVVVDVVAAYPGASAEEVERQVTIPLEVTFAGMRGLKSIHSRSQFGLSNLRMTWEDRKECTPELARQEVINRLATTALALPAGVTPALAPGTGPDLLRYLLINPRDHAGRPIYTAHDMRALQEEVLEREFRRLAGVADVESSGGAARRFEVQ